ncbi:MAG: cytochrome c peroxidase [Myxococcota bacterium]
MRLAVTTFLALGAAASVTWLARAQAPVESLAPLPPPEKLDPRKVELGKKLFHDVRLSRDQSISCSNCHPVGRGGVDGQRFSRGVGGTAALNTPSVLNAAFNFRQTWSGNAPSLEDVVEAPVLSPTLMGNNWDVVVTRLREAPAYAAAFNDLYGEVSAHGVKDAVAEYMRFIVPRGSRFDRFLMGETDALSPEEYQGYLHFVGYGCVSCHQGRNVGGNMYAPLGVMGDYFKERGEITKADLGRYNVTGRERDRHVFKVPSLRNVALTAPYFHDGSAATLDAAITIMARYQLGRGLTASEITQIAAFLNTLTGLVPSGAVP